MKISYVPGFFQHDQQPTGPDAGFRAQTLPRLGILERRYPSDDEFDPRSTKPQWERFRAYIEDLNKRGPAQYKVLFIIRHGEGFHNVKERSVGRAEWERHWSRLDGEGDLTWSDARLTDIGVHQAQNLASIILDTVRHDHMALPQTLYTSPLTRCLQTTDLVFSPLRDVYPGLPQPIIKEALREVTGVHTCDRRSPLSQIRAGFPQSRPEETFSEEDRLWHPAIRETSVNVAKRVGTFLVELFDRDPSHFVSLTVHSGTIRGLYAATGHPEVWPATGSMFPVVLKGEATSANER